jgi:large subunit ribosomal protein L21
MYAIVDIAGQQFKVKAGDKIFVHRLEGDNGSAVSFKDVLLTEDNGAVKVGAPTTGHTVNATIIEHLKDDKVVVFKKKRRKGYRKKNGHRQALTQIEITSIQ